MEVLQVVAVGCPTRRVSWTVPPAMLPQHGVWTYYEGNPTDQRCQSIHVGTSLLMVATTNCIR
jgi:hypothetical protein